MFSETTIAALLSLALLALFIWYWSTELDRTRRWLGTILTLIVAGSALFAVYPNAWKGDFQTSKIAKGIDLGGGTSFVVKINPGFDENGKPHRLTETDMDSVRATLESRLTQAISGRAKPITPVGENSLEIKIPGLTESEYSRVERELTRSAVLNFHLVDAQATQLLASGQPAPIGILRKELTPLGTDPANFTPEQREEEGAGQILGVPTIASVEGRHVRRAQPQYNGEWSIGIQLDRQGGQQIADVSRDNVGQRLAILLDGVLISAPSIRSTLGDSFEITGKFTQQEADDLARALNNPMRYQVTLDGISTITPELGKTAIQQGILAGIGSAFCVFLFLAIVYRLAGLIALFGIFINMLILFGAIALANQDLTLPGIAGVILSLGMAVDSNVLIYERLKEELQAGKSLRAALSASYDKAFSAIFDSNVTSLLTAVVLFWLGSDALKGFAATLVAGIVGTLFAALLVTRTCFRWLTDSGKLKSLRVGKPWKHLNFDFMGKAKPALIIAALLTVVAIAALVWRGNKNLSIEFLGGQRLTYVMPAGAPLDDAAVKSTLEGLDLPETPQPHTQKTPTTTTLVVDLGNDRELEQGQTPSIERVKQALAPLPGVAESLKASGEPTQQTIGAAFGKTMLRNSGLALLFGFIAIAIYLMLRFRPAFAVGASVALLHDIIVTVGIMSLFGFEVNTIMVGAYLTIAGYSINDTIVVLDRVRENLRDDQSRHPNLRLLMNEAINSTLSRTLLTSTTTLSSVAVLALFGGPDLRAFSLAIFIGIVCGTFSSIFVAAPVVYLFSRNKSTRLYNPQEEAKTIAPATN